jgi:hypothetical protein
MFNELTVLNDVQVMSENDLRDLKYQSGSVMTMDQKNTGAHEGGVLWLQCVVKYYEKSANFHLLTDILRLKIRMMTEDRMLQQNLWKPQHRIR